MANKRISRKAILEYSRSDRLISIQAIDEVVSHTLKTDIRLKVEVKRKIEYVERENWSSNPLKKICGILICVVIIVSVLSQFINGKTDDFDVITYLSTIYSILF